MSGRCWVFDIDGTLSDPTHRLHLIKQEKPDWRAFFAAVGGDGVHEHVAQLVRTLADHGEAIVLVTGRSTECHESTEDWLDEHVGEFARDLYMRAEGDHRPDDAVKADLIAEMRADGWEPIMAFDDRDRVVRAWRAAGIPCAQVAEGNF